MIVAALVQVICACAAHEGFASTPGAVFFVGPHNVYAQSTAMQSITATASTREVRRPSDIGSPSTTGSDTVPSLVSESTGEDTVSLSGVESD